MPATDGEKREDNMNERIVSLVQNFKQGSIVGSYNIAIQTVKLLRDVISKKRWQNAGELLELLRSDGKKMMTADRTDTTIGNMVKRVLKIVREEYARKKGKSDDDIIQDSLHKLISAEGAIDDYSLPCLDLKGAVIEAIGELISEIETSTDIIAHQSLEHIHSNEVILTAGYSHTLECFLKNAAKDQRRTFHVIVAECAPLYLGQKFAKNLAEANIETTIINDSAVFAIMSRVNKVIVGTHTVMANGGLKATSGFYSIALAAKYYSVPFLVCAPMYKLSPLYLTSYDQESFNKFLSPQNVIDYCEGEILSKISVYNPFFDYVPPELVTLYVSNIGGNSPSYVYRLLSEMYHPDDHDL